MKQDEAIVHGGRPTHPLAEGIWQAMRNKHTYLFLGLLCIAFVWMSYYLVWQVALLLLVLWALALVVPASTRLLQLDARIAVWFALLVAQTPHFGEHVAQMMQIHLFGWPWMQAHGVFGVVFDREWFHFAFDSLLIPFFWGWLLCLYGGRANRWLWLGLPLVFWHCAEHIAIMTTYLHTGVAGSPGLLAQGGMLGGGLPITRPDLHFLYNLAEEAAIFLGFRQEFRRLGVSWSWVCRSFFTRTLLS
jgi:hypothetical protein